MSQNLTFLRFNLATKGPRAQEGEGTSLDSYEPGKKQMNRPPHEDHVILVCHCIFPMSLSIGIYSSKYICSRDSTTLSHLQPNLIKF